jgi:hypothetical protein
MATGPKPATSSNFDSPRVFYVMTLRTTHASVNLILINTCHFSLKVYTWLFWQIAVTKQCVWSLFEIAGIRTNNEKLLYANNLTILKVYNYLNRELHIAIWQKNFFGFFWYCCLRQTISYRIFLQNSTCSKLEAKEYYQLSQILVSR